MVSVLFQVALFSEDLSKENFRLFLLPAEAFPHVAIALAEEQRRWEIVSGGFKLFQDCLMVNGRPETEDRNMKVGVEVRIHFI